MAIDPKKPLTKPPDHAYVRMERERQKARGVTALPPSEWADQTLHYDLVPNDKVIERMAWAGADSTLPDALVGLPSSLRGIFWIDQFLQSSIGKTAAFTGPDNGLFTGQGKNKLWSWRWNTQSTETLAAFGDWPAEWVSHEKQATLPDGRPNPLGTLRYVPNGGGRRGHWTFGKYMASGIYGACCCVDPLLKCCCFPDTFIGYTSVNVTWGLRMNSDFRFNVRDEIKDEKLNPEGLEMILDMAAGDKFVNTAPLFEMRMQWRPYGWVRTTHTIEGAGKDLSAEQWAELKGALPPPFYYGLKNGGVWGATQYPVIQIVDENGDKTPYYAEYLEWARRVNPQGQYMGTFNPDATGPKCCERCVGGIMTPIMSCMLDCVSGGPVCPCTPCVTWAGCCPCCCADWSPCCEAIGEYGACPCTCLSRLPMTKSNVMPDPEFETLPAVEHPLQRGFVRLQNMHRD